jgi:hypothetical protein
MSFIGKLYTLREIVVYNKKLEKFLNYFGDIISLNTKYHSEINDVNTLFNGFYTFQCDLNPKQLTIKSWDATDSVLLTLFGSDNKHIGYPYNLSSMFYRSFYEKVYYEFDETDSQFPVQFALCAISNMRTPSSTHKEFLLSSKTIKMCLTATKLQLSTIQFWIDVANSSCDTNLHIRYNIDFILLSFKAVFNELDLVSDIFCESNEEFRDILFSLDISNETPCTKCVIMKEPFKICPDNIKDARKALTPYATETDEPHRYSEVYMRIKENIVNHSTGKQKTIELILINYLIENCYKYRASWATTYLATTKPDGIFADYWLRLAATIVIV